jgi:hypothetical protein
VGPSIGTHPSLKGLGSVFTVRVTYGSHDKQRQSSVSFSNGDVVFPVRYELNFMYYLHMNRLQEATAPLVPSGTG